MLKYPFEEFHKDVKIMVRDIKENFEPEVILAIARGGLTLGHFLASLLNNRNLFTLNSIHYEETQKLDTIDIFNVPDLSKFNKILIVDDMIDTGESMVAIKQELLKRFPHIELKIATIFYKRKALLLPDFTVREAHEWIEFFWEEQI